MKRVVVTGMGLVSPIGCGNSEDIFRKLILGAKGIRNLEANEIPAQCNVKVAGKVPKGKNIGEYNDAEYKIMERETSLFIRYAFKASDYALQAAKLPTIEATREHYDPTRCGVCIGNGGIGSLLEINASNDALKHSSMKKISPYFVPKISVNMASGQVSIRHKLQGPVHSVATACAAGTHSIGDAFNFIRLGYADLMLAGGSDASIDPLGIAGFHRMKALAIGIEGIADEELSRPFDSKRQGFVMGEGAGIMILEELNSALKRNAPIYSEICGYGLSGDAFHATAPSAEGQGAYLSMSMALRSGNLSIQDIEYINAHATSTPVGDGIEITAIRRMYPASFENRKKTYVSSTKGATGHLLGAAGAVESIFTMMSLYTNLIPPTLHLEDMDKSVYDSDEDFFEHVPRHSVYYPTGEKIVSEEGLSRLRTKSSCGKEMRYALKNSFGFGGTNATLVLGKYPRDIGL